MIPTQNSKEPFVCYDASLSTEFESGWKLTELMQEHSLGCLTKRDNLVVGFTKDEVSEKIQSFIDQSKPTPDACEEFGLKLFDKDMWNADAARSSVVPSDIEDYVRGECFRPFDRRWIFYHPKFVARLNRRIMQHLDLRENLALVCVRQLAAPPFYHAWVVNDLTDQHIISVRTKEGGVVLPLKLVGGDQGELISATKANLDSQFIDELSGFLNAAPGSSSEESWALQVFFLIYAQLNSPAYRVRYEEPLCRDFPRAFIPSEATLFSELVKLGEELTELHLMESPMLDEPMTELIGERKFEVEKVSWSEDTVWIDKAQTTGFHGVPEDVWNFHVGSYQVCEKWLKDRQAKGGKNPRPGRTLTDEDIAHYQKIIVAISETIRIMGEIDEVIDQHGGWPDAFQSGDAARSKS